MPLVKSAWQSELLGNLSKFNGPKLPDLATAIATGSISHLVGKTFVTADVGMVPGSGVGVGVGITAIVAATVSAKIFSTAADLFKQTGPSLQDICDAIAKTLVSQMAQAQLSSVHPLVFVGAGTITPGTIPVDGDAWGSLIASAAPDFKGPQWPNFAKAIGIGCAAGFTTATGQVVIAGSPTAPTPVPGAGAGSGAIS